MELDLHRFARPTGGAHRRRSARGRTTLAALSAATVAVACGAATVGPVSATTTSAGSSVVGAVYIATNSWSDGNRILTFPRYADGSLGPVSASTPTGGRGSGPGQLPLIVSDPLGSQNSLITDPTGKYLFVVNAGSGDVSSFTVGRGGLALADREPSVPAGVTGQPNPFPVSLASTGSTLYVLNGIGNSVTGYSMNSVGHLTAFQNCALPALPPGNALDLFPATATSSQQTVDTQIAGQVGLSPDGKWLVVVSKEGPMSTGTPGGTDDIFPWGPTSGSGHLYAYPVATSGKIDCTSPRTTALPVWPDDGHGTFPFSFTWSAQGRLLLTEVFGKGDTPTSPQLSSIGSYRLNSNGTFTLMTNVADPLPVPCWIVRTGTHVFVANFLGPTFGAGAISRFEVGSDGALVDPSPSSAPTTRIDGGSDPIDVALTADGKFLYQLAPGPNPAGPGQPTAQVYPFAVGADGSLTALPPVNDGVGGAGSATHADAGEFGIATATFK